MGVLAALTICLTLAVAAVHGTSVGQYSWYEDSPSTVAGEVYRPLTASATHSASTSSMTSTKLPAPRDSTASTSSSGFSASTGMDAGLDPFIHETGTGAGSIPGGLFAADSQSTHGATADSQGSAGGSDVGVVVDITGGHGSGDLGLGLTFSQESYDLLNEILGTSRTYEDDDSAQIVVEQHHHHHHQQLEQQPQQHQQQQHHQQQQQPQQPQHQQLFQQHSQEQQQQQQQQQPQQQPELQTTDAQTVIAEILDKGTTNPGTSGTVSMASSLDLAYQRYSFAARGFAKAQKAASDAELAVIQARETVSSEGGEAVAKAVSSSRADAVAIISTTRATVRDNVSAARTAYVSAATRVHSKVTEMRSMEKRFRALAVSFAKVRLVASQALVGLKKIKTANVGVIGHLTGYKGEAYARAFEVCKTKVKTMKAVEKQFIEIAKAYAGVRSTAKSCVKDVRKAAFTMAQTCSAATVKVSSAVALATETVSKAITVAKATSIARAVATVNAVENDRDDAYDDLREAGLTLGQARGSLEAIVDDQNDDTKDSSPAAGYDDSIKGFGDAPSGHAPSYPAPNHAATSSVAVRTASSSDKTDTMATY